MYSRRFTRYHTRFIMCRALINHLFCQFDCPVLVRHQFHCCLSLWFIDFPAEIPVFTASFPHFFCGFLTHSPQTHLRPSIFKSPMTLKSSFPTLPPLGYSIVYPISNYIPTISYNIPTIFHLPTFFRAPIFPAIAALPSSSWWRSSRRGIGIGSTRASIASDLQPPEDPCCWSRRHTPGRTRSPAEVISHMGTWDK